jgi:hypothetical protein
MLITFTSNGIATLVAGLAATIRDEKKFTVSDGIDVNPVAVLAATIREDMESNISNGIAATIRDEKKSTVSDGIDANPVAELAATIREDMESNISNDIPLNLVVESSANITDAIESHISDGNKVTLAAKSIKPLLHDHSDLQMTTLDVESQSDNVNSLSRPRDRDSSSDPTLVGGSDSELAGQASTFGSAPSPDGALTQGTHHDQVEAVD